MCATELVVFAGVTDPVMAVVVDVDKEYTNSEINSAIDEYVHSERDRAILKRRLIDGILFEPLAEEFGLSVRQIKSIVYKQKDKLFSHI